MKSKILKTILGLPIVMIGCIIIGLAIGTFAFFGWLFNDNTCREISQDLRRQLCSPVRFLRVVWK